MNKDGKDGQWHSAIMYQRSDDGEFVIVESIDEIDKDFRPKTLENGAIKYQEIQYNWNHGQIIVDTGISKFSIVDMDSV